ncbi:MAG TPA: FtsQ-type POTRA domain-containing protein [Gaiellaceae bacterium]|nr:FtsQ-type POTRA domain-containing protein [Gaiellaceae bacterium]
MSPSVLSLPRRRPPAVLQLLPSGRALIVAGASVLAAVSLYVLARETSMFAIRTIDVRGASPALSAQAQGAIDSFVGTNLLRLNGAAVVRRLEQLPGIASASYDRDFPHTLRVFVVPERASAVLRQGTSSWLVSAGGRVIASVDPSRYPRLPRIWLPQTVQVEVGSVLEEDSGGAAARSLAALEQSRLTRGVAWARVANGQLTVGLRSGLEVLFGNQTELGLKAAIVRQILPTIVPASAGGPTYLDVSVPERPVSGINPQPSG